MSGAGTSGPTSAAPTIGRRDSLRVAAATALSALTGYAILTVAARVLVPVPVNTQFVTFWSTLFAFFGVLSGMSVETTRAVTAESLAGGPAHGAPGRRRPSVLAAGLGVGAAMAVLVAATSALWAPHLLPEHTLPLTAALCLAVAGFAAHAVLTGSLAGRRRWSAYSGLIAADATVRLVLVLVALLALTSVPAAALASSVATLTWAGYLLVSRDARAAAAARVDSDLPVFLRRVLAASLASGASALLVVGFPVLLSLTTSRREYALAAPLLLAISLTRAPLLVPLTAYQGVAVSHFVQHRERGLRVLVPVVRLVLLVAAAGAAAAWAVGPWLMEALLGPSYRVGGPLLAALTLAAAALAVLTLTGALCQALTLHGRFVAGWVVAVVGALAVLALPLPTEPRAAVALLAGPLVGALVHLGGLRHAAREASPTQHPTEQPAEVVPEVSVCLATYDGAAYVTEQLESVLAQLGPHDEVVVVDDASRDDTVARVQALADPRVRLITSPVNRGYVAAFEASLREARGRYLLLCDQDDVWAPGRVAPMVAALGGADVVATNLGTLGGPDRLRGPYGQADWRLTAQQSREHARNVLAVLAGNRPYYGCAMGVRREALATVLPFPAFLTESHDLWIALYGNLAGSVTHLELRSVQRRFHEGNASAPRPRGPRAVLASRLMLVRCVRELRRRLRG